MLVPHNPPSCRRERRGLGICHRVHRSVSLSRTAAQGPRLASLLHPKVPRASEGNPATRGASNNRNVFSHSSRGWKSEAGGSAGPCSLQGCRGRSVPCLSVGFRERAGTSWLVAPIVTRPECLRAHPLQCDFILTNHIRNDPISTSVQLLR